MRSLKCVTNAIDILIITAVIAVANGGNSILISATLEKGISIILNGKPFEPKETDGTELKPIMYNERVYVPLRAITESTDMRVDWNGNTETVLVDSIGDPNASRVMLSEDKVNIIYVGQVASVERNLQAGSGHYKSFFEISGNFHVK
jgi:hypothetical protein